MTNLIPANEELKTLEAIAQNAFKSGYFHKLGGKEGLLTLMLYAKELGIAPMNAIFGGLHNIKGKVEISPRLMNALIRKAGHRLDILESTDKVCRIKGTRSDTKEEYECIYSIEEAQRSGVLKPESGWSKFPSDMLFKSCLSRLARRLFPDIILESYVEGEISEPLVVVEDENEKVETTISEAQTEILANYTKKLPIEKIDAFLNHYKIFKIQDLKTDNFDGALKKLKLTLESLNEDN